MKNMINFKYFMKFKDYYNYLLKGIFAGLLISMGAICYLSIEDKVAGTFLFSLGLLTVCMYGMNLFTGKIGYVLNNGKEYLYEVLLGLLGNFLGTFITAKVMLLTRYKDLLSSKALTLVTTKLEDTPISIFILSMFCGILIFIAVNNYKKINTEIGKYAGIFMCIMAFILCGFEHCVANMFYFSLAGVFNLKAITYIIIMILGNTWGSILISWFYNLYYK